MSERADRCWRQVGGIRPRDKSCVDRPWNIRRLPANFAEFRRAKSKHSDEVILDLEREIELFVAASWATTCPQTSKQLRDQLELSLNLVCLAIAACHCHRGLERAGVWPHMLRNACPRSCRYPCVSIRPNQHYAKAPPAHHSGHANSPQRREVNATRAHSSHHIIERTRTSSEVVTQHESDRPHIRLSQDSRLKDELPHIPKRANGTNGVPEPQPRTLQ